MSKPHPHCAGDLSISQYCPYFSRTDSRSFAESYPTPSLNTISTFSTSEICFDGSPFIHQQVRILSHRNRTNLFVLSHVDRAIQRRNPDRLHGRKPFRHQQLNFALITKSGNHVASSRRVRPGDQQSARPRKLQLQPGSILEQLLTREFWSRR